MTGALYLIALAEFSMAMMIVYRFGGSMEPEEFFTRAPLDKVIQVIGHLRMAWIALQAATIWSLLK